MNDNIQFSQNFLRDPKLVNALLSKININPEDTVYDIGSGKGIITTALASKCRVVISIEIDPHLANELRQNLHSHDNVLVYQADFLSLPLPQTRYKVFSNIPFNLSADILRKLTSTPYPPVTSYLIVQKEFADKLISRIGGHNSQLSILLGAQFRIRVVQQLNPANFYPRPKVKATLLEISARDKPLVATAYLALYRDFITYNYNACQPNVLQGLTRLFTRMDFKNIAKTLHIPADATPTQLDLQQWLTLFNLANKKHLALKKLVGGQEQIIEQRHSKRTKIHRTRSPAGLEADNTSAAFPSYPDKAH